MHFAIVFETRLQGRRTDTCWNSISILSPSSMQGPPMESSVPPNIVMKRGNIVRAPIIKHYNQVKMHVLWKVNNMASNNRSSDF